MGVKLSEIRLEDWEKDLGKFSLSDGDEVVRIRRDFVRAEKEVNDFLSTNTTRGKELGYYGNKVVKPLKIFSPQLVKRLNSIGGSRDSVYYQVDYLDAVSSVRGSFLVDAGWREREFLKVADWNNSMSSLVLRKGERCDFLVGVS